MSLGSLARALASALYWWGVGWLVYMVTGGDPVPLDQPRTVWQDYGPVSLIVIAAILLYAAITHMDRARR